MESTLSSADVAPKTLYIAGALLAGAACLGYSIKKQKDAQKNALAMSEKLKKLPTAADTDYPRVLTIYFNDKDEMVEERVVKRSVNKKRYQKVKVYVGKESHNQIPKSIFGDQKKENAKIFMEKLREMRQKSSEERAGDEGSLPEFDSFCEKESEMDESQIALNLDPKHYES